MRVDRPGTRHMLAPKSLVMPLAAFGMIGILGSVIYYSLRINRTAAQRVRGSALEHELLDGSRADRRKHL